MQNATVTIITALHALAHRIALTEGESVAMEAYGGPLNPALWEQTLSLFAAADAESDDDYTRYILVWLAMKDESAFVDRFGIGVREALSADAAQVHRIARAVDCPHIPVREALRCQITVAWCDRANYLLETLSGPENAAPAIQALEAALMHCPADQTWHSRLYEAIARAAAVTGDRHREANAKARLEIFQSEDRPDAPIRMAAARLLSVLWCRAHGAYQLGPEQELDPHVPANPSLWRLVRTAIDCGGLDQIPMPADSCVVWTCRAALAAQIDAVRGRLCEPRVEGDPEGLRRLLDRARPYLGELAAMVESVWSGTPGSVVDPINGLAVARVAIVRRQTIQDDWEGLEGQARCPWLELHQGPQREDTVARVALAELLHPVLARSAAYDVRAGALVALDQAASASAQADAEGFRVALGHAATLTDQLPPTSPWWGYGRVRCAVHLWQCGDPDQAIMALERIATPAAAEAMATVRSYADVRRVAQGLEARWRDEPTLEAGSLAMWTHHEAGHLFWAREIAAEMTSRWPDDGAVWAVLGALLAAQNRYRDAQFVARTALDRGCDPDEGQRLLERVESALCVQSEPDGFGHMRVAAKPAGCDA